MLGETGHTEFTTISLSKTPPQSTDRRAGQRYMSVLQAGKIMTDTLQELCLIRNISSRGVMAEIFAPLETGTPVQIEFKAGAIVRGTVRWVEEGRAGIEFDENIDVHEVLAPHTGRMAPRAPRLNIDSMARVMIGDVREKLQVFDISQGGVKVESGMFLEPGLDVVVEIEGLPVRASVVRWVGGQYAGISFNRVMPLDQVAYWAAQQGIQSVQMEPGPADLPSGH
ncbi:PilZ domain-containing protein [Parasphingopyxis algicola]|uniref:PilZ domain-containing protein n=1 Tax=Parasphingopyxis algicola TaxID=2026624 RepID=UPI0015A3F830|nr:PilZ domain-containing protein [Parasphingopyxis algicola]QLC25440.1 PilZ domain-containing protein [Parasphingopyxis algicola]